MGVRSVLDDIATFAQLSGLHVAMLVALSARLLRIPQCEAECARLEESARRLRELLRWPWPAGGDAAVLYGTGAGLAEAAGLVDAYRRSTLWRRVRTSRTVEARLRDARDGVDCLWVLLLCAHANNLIAAHPASDADAT
jgi:hypothetical protein